MGVVGGARRRLVVGAVTVGCLVVLVACNPTAEPPQRLGDPQTTGGDGVCGLLVEEELETALNAPLDAGGQLSAADGPSGDGNAAEGAGGGEGALTEGAEPGALSPPQTGTPRTAQSDDADMANTSDGPPAAANAREPRPLVAGMDMCARGSGDARAAWGVLSGPDDSEQEEDAADDEQPDEAAEGEGNNSADEAFKRYMDWHGDYLEGVGVDGYDAVWDARLQTLLVHADNRLVGVSLTVPNPPVGGDRPTEDNEEPDDTDEADEADDGADGGDEADEEADAEVDLTPEAEAYLQQQAQALAARILGRL